MALLLVRVQGVDTMIVGYAPGAQGPLAIVVLDGELKAVGLSEIELVRIPKRLRHAQRRAKRKLHLVSTDESIAKAGK